MVFKKKHLITTGASLLLALILSLALTSNAFAATGNTNVSLVAEDANISVTVPTDFEVKINGDGSFIAPSNVSFSNDSIFAIHVSGASVTSEPNYSLVSEPDFNSSPATNALWTKISPATGNVIDLGVSPSPAGWSMAKAGDTGSELALTFTGAIKNMDAVPTTATKVYGITWTVAAGA